MLRMINESWNKMSEVEIKPVGGVGWWVAIDWVSTHVAQYQTERENHSLIKYCVGLTFFSQ